MSYFTDDNRKFRSGSLLSAPSASSVPPPKAQAEALPDDAASRHERARARREGRVDSLLSAMPAAAHHAATREEMPEADGKASANNGRTSSAPARTPPQPVAVARQSDAPPRTAPLDAAGPAAHSEYADTVATPAQQGGYDAGTYSVQMHPDAPAFAEEQIASQARRSRLLRSAAIMAIIGATMGAVLAVGWPKSYVATSEVLIDPRETQAAGVAASLSPDAAFALVDNQLRVLRSGSMLNAVADRLNLASDSEFNGTSTGLAGIVTGVSDLLSGDGAQAVEQRRRHAVEELAKSIQTERVGGSVVRVSATTADPQKSALIANTITELFVAGSARLPTDGGANLAALRTDVEKAERAVAAYKAENGLIDAQGRLITDDEILRLGERLSTARARTVELNARASSAREVDVDSIVTGSLPEQYASPTVADLRARHAELKQQLDRLSVKLGPRHPERLAAEAEMESARQDMRGELRRVAAALQTELRRAVQQEQELAAELARMKSRQSSIGDDLVALRDLERDANARREAYENALRATHSGAPSVTAGVANLISRAEPPSQATGPSLPVFTVAGGFAGLLAGLGFAGWRKPQQDFADFSGPAYDDETAVDASTGKDAEDMNPYFAYAQPEQGSQPQHQSQAPHSGAYPQQQTPAYHPAQQHAPQPSGHGYAQQPSPAQHMPPYPQPVYPAYPQAAAPAYASAYPMAHQPMPQQAMPQQPPQPMYYGAPQHPGYPPVAPAPHDPWATQHGFAPHPQFPQQVYAPAAPFAPPAQPVHTIVYVPMPQAAPMPATAAAHETARRPVREPAPRHASPREDVYDQDSYVDERTDAAIQEIRQNLRAFREAIEEFAEERSTQRRYGT